MNSSRVHPVIKRRCAKLERHYDNLVKDFDEEEIHQFRLQMKKTKAYLSLVSAVKEIRKEMKVDKGLRRFYDTIGELRNLQLHQKDARSLCDRLHLSPPTNYLQSLVRQEEDVKVRARQMALENPVRSCCEKLLERAPNHLDKEAIIDFLNDRDDQLLKIITAGEYSDDNIYSIRKSLKRFIYVWRWVEAEIESLPRRGLYKRRNLNALAEKIGDFQNLRVSLTFLTEHRSGQNGVSDEAAVLDEMIQAVQAEKQALKEKILSRLQAFGPFG